MEEVLITPESLLARNEDEFLFAEVDDETVLMSINDSGYLGLNAVTTDIWKLLSTPQTATNLIAKLVKMYDVEPEQCEQEVNTVLKAMVRRKIVQTK